MEKVIKVSDDVVEVDGVLYDRREAVEKGYSGAMYKPEPGAQFYYIRQSARDGHIRLDTGCPNNNDKVEYGFKTESHAKQYADAQNTMFALRETSVLPENKVSQVYLCLGGPSFNSCYASDNTNIRVKYGQISPIYSTYEDAQAAKDRVGEEKIIKMMKVFKGVYDD